MNLPPFVLLLISFAWTALQAVLVRVGVPQAVIDVIAQVLRHFGLLSGSKQLTMEEMLARASALEVHCASKA